MQYIMQFSQLIRGNKLRFNVLKVDNASKVIGIVTFHFCNTQFFTFPVYTCIKVFYNCMDLLQEVRWCMMFAGINILLDLSKYPRVSYTRTTNHYTIYTIFVFVVNCFLRSINISITKNRYFHPMVFFDSGN